MLICDLCTARHFATTSGSGSGGRGRRILGMVAILGVSDPSGRGITFVATTTATSDVASVRTGKKTWTDRSRRSNARVRVSLAGIRSFGARNFMVLPRYGRVAGWLLGRKVVNQSGKRQERMPLLAPNTGWPETKAGVTSSFSFREQTRLVARGVAPQLTNEPEKTFPTIGSIFIDTSRLCMLGPEAGHSLVQLKPVQHRATDGEARLASSKD